MSKIILLILFLSVCRAKTSFHGPFILWGITAPIDNSEIVTLKPFNNNILQKYFTKADKIMILLKSDSIRLEEKLFSKTRHILRRNRFIYLPQDVLPSDPYNFTKNIYVSILVDLNFKYTVKANFAEF